MKLRFLPLLLILIAFVVGCDKDEDNPTVPPTWTPTDSTWADGTGGYNVRLNATDRARYRYYDFATRNVVDITDAAAGTNSNWTIAFSRYYAKTNGGASGSANISSVSLAKLGIANATDWNAITTLPLIADSLWESDEASPAIADADWWFYTGPPSHAIVPVRTCFVVNTASGKYAKFVVDSINGSTRTSIGQVTISYVFNGSGTNLSGTVQTATLDATTNPAYFSFANGVVNVGDAATSTAWDLMVKDFSIKVNSGISGPGAVAVLKSDTTFQATAEATVGPPYSRDISTSIFGTETVDPWFDYNQQHELVTRNNVYLLKTSAGLVYKVQIQNYYLIVGGASQSGWIQFRFKQL